MIFFSAHGVPLAYVEKLVILIKQRWKSVSISSWKNLKKEE